MSTTISAKSCPQCGETIPVEAPQGLCPKCLLREVSIPTEAGKGAPAKADLPDVDELKAAFPHLEIIELIGQGGMGLVYKARQPKLDRFVALKIMPQSLASDPTFTERFTREGRVLAKLNHPNIVTVHDFGQANGFFYLLMEFVNGVNLRQATQAGRFTPAQALGLVPEICEALQYAHTQGILHRDIKPENILLDANGRVKIADFGIAKLMSDPNPSEALTGTGASIGTPHYMAPEQIENPAEVDHRADIYSLGVVLYELLTGELPLGKFPPPSEKTPLNPGVDAVVLRALEKQKEKRYQSARDVKTGVENLGTAETIPIERSFVRRLLMIIGIVLLALLGAFAIAAVIYALLGRPASKPVAPAVSAPETKTIRLYNAATAVWGAPVMRFPGSPVLPAKTKLDHLSIYTSITLRPQEKFRPTFVFADGQSAQGGVHEITRRENGDRYSIYIFRWILPDSISAEEMVEAGARLKAWEGKSATLTAGEPTILVRTTNTAGEEIRVCLAYVVEAPPADAPVIASMRVTGTNVWLPYPPQRVTATLDASLPPAHALDCIGLTLNGALEENTHLSDSRSQGYKSLSCEWSFPNTFTADHCHEAARQLAGASFFISPGVRANAFCVTNASGDVFRAYLELLPPK